MNQPEINVTPLIDVLLVLLIIFMVITPTNPSAFGARLPGEQKPGPPRKPHPLTLVVSYRSDSSILINKEPSFSKLEDTRDLTARLQAIFREREENLEYERTVFIKAPTSLNYGSVAILIDAVKAAGADPVSLQIDDLDR